jgi:hypothetical protein
MSRLHRRTGALALVTALAILPAAPAPAKPSGGTVTFATPGTHAWTVPAKARHATFEVYGAAGGAGPDGAAGGLGARVRATLAVRRGVTYTIVVGGRGGDVVGRTAGAGGFNGGGPGGAGAEDVLLPIPGGLLLAGGPGGAGGGGASDVRTGSALSARLVVAGGGGGAAEVPGGAGGRTGEDGADGPTITNTAPLPDQQGGGGGTATAGGAGSGGAPGGAGAGGEGADAPTPHVVSGGSPGLVSETHGGGGGGAGLFGGGGGTSGHHLIRGAADITFTSTGGGGGSSLAPAFVACPPVVQNGVRAGDGLVVVRWTKARKARRACRLTAGG